MTSQPPSPAELAAAPSGLPAAAPEETADTSARADRRPLYVTILAVIVLDVLAAVFMPPAGFPSPAAGINSNLEFPPPHVVYDLTPADHPTGRGLWVGFDASISSTVLTTWLVIAVVAVLAFFATRRLDTVPRAVQNVLEYVYEGLRNTAHSLGGEQAVRYVMLFAAFFIFIAVSNWSGLLPFVGRVEFLRAPTSDLNVTIGLALVSFVVIHLEGVRSLGFGPYFGKFFNFAAFRGGLGAGLIALYVGFIEFLLEFFKPITLAMRLFGNIYGGEVMLGVMTALLLAIVPLPFIALEAFVGFVQALIFSVLTLMFILLATESHAEEEHAAPEYAPEPMGSVGPPLEAMPSDRAPAQ